MSPVRMGKIEAALRAAQAYHQALNRKDVEAVLALMDENCVLETAQPAPDGSRFQGKAAVRAHLEAVLLSEPSGKRSIEDLVGMGKRSILRWRLEREGGRVRGVDIFLVEDEMIREIYSYVKG